MEKKDTNILNVAFSTIADTQVLPLCYLDSDVAFFSDADRLPEVYSVKFQFNLFIGSVSGVMELDVNDAHYVVAPGSVFVCPSGQTITNLTKTPDFKFHAMCITDRMVQNMLSAKVDTWHRAVYVRQARVVSPPPNSNSKHGVLFIQLLQDIVEYKENPFREEMVRSMLQLLLLGYCAMQKKIEEKESENPLMQFKSPQGRVLFNRFCELLRDEDVKHQPVYYYAEKLCISAKYLSYICKEVTGKSANDFIQQAVIEDITNYLRNTTLSVKEIAARLGFSNISFFGKYVKSHFGVSPNEYRKQVTEGKK